MSRKENEHRRISGYVEHHFMGKGAVIANFAADLAAGCWLAHNMDHHTRFHNALVAYYFELLLWYDAQKRYHVMHCDVIFATCVNVLTDNSKHINSLCIYL